jgi:transcriptional regulator with XRE-family HTH domain
VGYHEDPRTLGEHLRRRRMDLGLLQREVAKRIGVSVDTVLGWEIRGRQPAVRSWPAILAFLGADPYPEPRTTAEQLKAVRRQQGWSQRRLAASLGVDPTSVRDWEAGQEPKFARCRGVVRHLVEFGVPASNGRVAGVEHSD